MRRSILVLMLGALLAACGQKGPLYLPPKPAPADVPAPAASVDDDEEKKEDGAATSPASQP